jgi:hypothetical protein
VHTMGRANMGHFNEDEEANPPAKSHGRQPSRQPRRPHDKRSRCSTKSLRGRRPDIQLLYHTWQTTNTIFRDRRPDVSPLELEPQRRMTQLPIVQATQEKLLIDHGRCTNIRGRRPGLKVKTTSSKTASTEPTTSPH